MTHIAKETLAFLSDLKAHNARDWFADNKPRYEAARADFEAFVAQLIGAVAQFEPTVAPLEAKDCVMRIYRDTRFSKDKTPYKTSLNAHLLAGGRRQERGRAGYYIHLAPGDCFLAGGAYTPSGEWMGRIRASIETDAGALKKIVGAKDFKKYFGAITGAQLKTAPRGYAKDHAEIELLRYKSFLAVHAVPDKVATGPRFLVHAGKVFAAMQPFDAFLNR